MSPARQHLAFAVIRTEDWDANSTWQLLSALTHNRVRDFQATLGVEKRPSSRKRTARLHFPSLRTMRFELFQLPARIARPAGGNACGLPRQARASNESAPPWKPSAGASPWNSARLRSP